MSLLLLFQAVSSGPQIVGDGDPITVSIRAAGRTVTLSEADRTTTVRALGRTIEIGAKPS